MTLVVDCWDDIQYDRNKTTGRRDVPVKSGHVTFYRDGAKPRFIINRPRPDMPSIAERLKRYYRQRGWAEFPLRTTESRGYEFHVNVKKEAYE